MESLLYIWERIVLWRHERILKRIAVIDACLEVLRDAIVRDPSTGNPMMDHAIISFRLSMEREVERLETKRARLTGKLTSLIT